MTNYALLYRLGLRPWEGYRDAAAASVDALFDREGAERTPPLGRALDLGCGRGQYTPELARRGWDAVGIDAVPRAIEAARQAGGAGATYVVGDVTRLAAADLGTFDFFLDIGCFQSLDARKRADEGRGVTELANPGATLLMMAFGRTRVRPLLEGVSRQEVESAFADWVVEDDQPAETVGLGWPMNRTSPRWYRLRIR
jgi:SAM-dependent methyltransferase